MATTGMLINILLNLYLIPRMEARGAAISSITTQLLTAIAQILMVQYIFRFKINYTLLVGLGAFAASCIAWCWFIRGNELNWMLQFGLAAAGCFALALVTRLISPKNIYRIIRYDES
jgi:O-antigen/teichoic acid export membrane protein